MVNFTEEAREMIIEDLLTMIPTLSDEALWHIAIVLLDEKRIIEQGGTHEKR